MCLRWNVFCRNRACGCAVSCGSNAEESGNGVTATTIASGYVDTDMSAWIRDRIPPQDMLTVNDVVERVDSLLRLSSRAVVANIVMSRAGTDGYRA